MKSFRAFSTAPILEKSLKAKLKDVINAKPVDSTAARRDRKQRQHAKIQNYRDFKQTEEQLAPHLDNYLSKVSNVINKKPDFAPNHPAVYKYLGTSRDQLKNPYMVSEEIQKLLKKNKVAKAVFIVRLAGANGSVGMNKILKHLTDQGQHSQGLKLFNRMKKWGAKENEFTNINLQPKKDTEKIFRTFENAKSNIDEHDRKRQTVNANNTLKSLASAQDVDALVQVFDDLKFKDRITYTTVLNTIARLEPTDELLELRDRVWQEVKDDQEAGYLNIDVRLMRAYLNSKCGTIVDARRAMTEMSEFFKLPGQEYGAPFAGAELDLLMKILYKSGDYQKAMEYFEQTDIKLEWPHYNYYIKSIARTGDVKRAETLLAQFEGFTTNPPSTMYADLIRTFCWTVVEPRKIDRFKRACQKAWGKRLHVAVVDAYASAYTHCYQNSDAHPRDGVKALNDIALGHQALAQNLIRKQNIGYCKHAVDQTVLLGNLIFTHPSWTKHRFIWIKKMTEFFETLQKELQTDQVASKTIQDFVYDMETIVKRK